MKIDELVVNDVVTEGTSTEEAIVVAWINLYSTPDNEAELRNIACNNEMREHSITAERVKDLIIGYRLGRARAIFDHMEHLPLVAAYYAADLNGKHVMIYYKESGEYRIVSEHELQKFNKKQDWWLSENWYET